MLFIENTVKVMNAAEVMSTDNGCYGVVGGDNDNYGEVGNGSGRSMVVEVLADNYDGEGGH